MHLTLPDLERQGVVVVSRFHRHDDAGADAEIVTAMRTGVAMSVETRSQSGGLLRDEYPLRGAATAVDAAAIACAR